VDRWSEFYSEYMLLNSSVVKKVLEVSTSIGSYVKSQLNTFFILFGVWKLNFVFVHHNVSYQKFKIWMSNYLDDKPEALAKELA